MSHPDLPSTLSFSALRAAARHGSFSAAAEELGVTHGAISRRIDALERWLGSPIFERHGRGVRLTPAGAQLSQRAERSFAAISALASDIRTARQPGLVRLSVLPSFARLWVAQRLPELEGWPRDVTVQLQLEHPMAELSAKGVDLAVRMGYGDWAGLDATLLMHETLVPAAAPSIAAGIGRAEEIFDQHVLHDSDRVLWKRWAQLAGVDFRAPAGERRFVDYDLALSAASAGLGIVLARLPLASGFLASGALVRLPGPAMPIGRAHWLVFRQGETRPAVLTLADRMLRSAAPSARLD